jgi:hypothetical protein
VRAYQIRATNPDLLPSVINFANQVKALHVQDQINGLKMTTGKFGVFRPLGDVFNLDMTVSGPIRDLLITGDLAEGSIIRTQGRVGNMGNIRINGRLDGELIASGKIKRLFVGESLSGRVASLARKGNALGTLIIGGALSEGALNIEGNVGRVQFFGSVGRTGQDLIFAGNVKSLIISGDLFSNVRVGGRLGKLQVGGSIITGVTVDVGNRLGALIVGGDVQPGVIIQAQRVGRERITGQMLGQIIEA